MSKLLRMEKVSKVFKKGGLEILALKDIDIELFEGEFVCITGRSGSGKTTFLNIAGFLDVPTSGNIFYLDRPVSFSSYDEMTEFRRNNIGFIFQKLYLQSHLTAIENILLPVRYSSYSLSDAEERALELLRSFGLADRRDFFPFELSGGECQRIAIARALINSPKIILADEPTSDLDNRTSVEVMDILKDISENRKASVLTVTHDSSVVPYGDRVFIMDEGMIRLA